MDEFENLLEDIELDLDVVRCEAALPRLLQLSESDAIARTRVLLLSARCYFVARDVENCEKMMQTAREVVSTGPIESRVRLALVEASLLTTGFKLQEAAEKLAFAEAYLSEVPIDVRALALGLRGRNEAYAGAYSEAIEYSQEAILLSTSHSSTASVAYGTIAYVFQAMGRYDDAEQYGKEQIRILTERGSKHGVAGLYAFLGSGASSRQDWKKALEYQGLAVAAMGDTPGGSSIRPVLLSWMASSNLGLGNLDQALEYVNEALAIARQAGETVLTMNAEILLSDIHFKKGEFERALSVLQLPLAASGQLGDSQRIHLYRSLAQTYQALNRKAEAFDICWRLWELQTDFDGRTREALLRYHRSLEQKIHAQKTAILNLKATQMERELALTASQLASQTELLGRFRNDLREIVRETDEPNFALKKVKEKLKELPCEQVDWVKFEAQFASVHPEFKTKLEEKHPDLTRSEVKICALSRLKLTSEEIGRLQCLSARSVETHRLNIRRKLGLKKEQNLGAYLAAL